MKILHIHLLGPYTDNWGYQENVLPRIQYNQGHEVTVLTNCQKHLPDNSIINVAPGEYIVDEGVHVIRIKMRKHTKKVAVNSYLFDYPLKKYLNKINPDVILLHGLGLGITNFYIKNYVAKHRECRLYGDVHENYNNVSSNKRDVLHIILRTFSNHCRKILYKYYESVLCLTDDCKKFAIEQYKVNESKTILFPLGYDPYLINWKNRFDIRNEIREKYGIDEKEIVIIHGGKIIPRRNTDIAIKAFEQINIKNKRLLIFGTISDEILSEIKSLIDRNSDIIYLGNLSQKDYLEHFLASDIAFFPGGQSVLWQEAIGCGLPLVIKKWSNIEYLNRGGNVIAVDGSDYMEYAKQLNYIINSHYYREMAQIAETAGRDFFSYERISNIMLQEK